MQYWLIKSEPDVFSYDDLVRDGSTRWDGVRNYQARNNLRAMQQGDLCIYYHSNIGLAAVGIATVLRTHYPDPTAESADWSAIDVGPYRALERPVSLAVIKAHPDLQQIGLVRNPRLSVMPLSREAFDLIVALATVPDVS
jgi:predicted RNA-binding protein with PUA-like domain